MIGMLDTLEYLAKGGRVPRVAAWLSSLVQVKPLFEFHDGQSQPAGGGAHQAPRPGPPAGPDAPTPEPGQAPSRGRLPCRVASERPSSWLTRCEQEFRPVELYITEFSQVMSIHSGPGLVGLAFYNEP